MTITASRWAWRQPSFKESVTAHWSKNLKWIKSFCAKNVEGLKLFTETVNKYKLIILDLLRIIY